jgi:CHASE2 domain-containing sensor protein/class 3 adenylate cyclase
MIYLYGVVMLKIVNNKLSWSKNNHGLPNVMKTSLDTFLMIIFVSGVLIAGSYLNFFRILEWLIFDQFFILRPPESIEKRIVVVTIDEPDIQYVKEWPMSDAVMAQMIQNIKAQEPRVIGIDVYRDLPVEPGHENLVKLFKNTPNFVGIEKVTEPAVAPPPSLAELGQVSANDLISDTDGQIRRAIILLGKPDGSLIQGLGVKLALMYLEEEEIQLSAINPEKQIYGLGNATFIPLSKNDGEYTQADMGGYQILLNYRGGLDRFLHISMTEVLENRIPDDLMRDRIVFVGSKAPSLNDNYPTPYNHDFFQAQELMPGVVIHANITSQILSSAMENRPMLRAWNKQQTWGFIIICCGYSTILGSLYIRRRWVTITGVFMAAGAIITTSYVAFLSGWLIPVFTPLLAIFSGAIVSVSQVLWKNLMLSYRQLEDYAQNLEQKVSERTRELELEKEKSERLLLNILPKEIADELKEKEGIIADSFEEATILFSDIVGFTPLSSRISAVELVNLLNEMFSIFDEIAGHYHLEKIKTIGDAYMLAGGIPIARQDHAEAVANMALEMQVKMADFQEKLNEPLQIRVGIHTGPVVAGVIGTRKFIYDLWGDAVNIASRMESSGSPGKIQVSPATYEKLKDKFILEERGQIKVKGKGEMTTYWLLGKK